MEDDTSEANSKRVNENAYKQKEEFKEVPLKDLTQAQLDEKIY